MNIPTEKLELIRLLLATDNPQILASVKNIFKKEKAADFWEDLTPDQQQEIQEATLEISRGEFTDYDAFMKKHR